MDDVQFIGDREIRRYLLGLPFRPKVIWKDRYPNGSPGAIDLLEKLLKLNPNHRGTAEECLKHPFLERYSDSKDEPVMKTPIIYETELKQSCTTKKIKCLIFEESERFPKD